MRKISTNTRKNKVNHFGSFTAEGFELVSLKRMAENSPYSQAYLSLLVQRGRLRAEKIGKNYYTTKEWFNDYLKLYARDCKKSTNNSLVGECLDFDDSSFVLSVAYQYFLNLFFEQSELKINTDSLLSVVENEKCDTDNKVKIDFDNNFELEDCDNALVENVQEPFLNEWTKALEGISNSFIGVRKKIKMIFWSRVLVSLAAILLFSVSVYNFNWDFKLNSIFSKNINFIFGNIVLAREGIIGSGMVAGDFSSNNNFSLLSATQIIKKCCSNTIFNSLSFIYKKQERFSSSMDSNGKVANIFKLGGDYREQEKRYYSTGLELLNFKRITGLAKDKFFLGLSFYSSFLDIFIPKSLENEYGSYYSIKGFSSDNSFIKTLNDKVDSFFHLGYLFFDSKTKLAKKESQKVEHGEQNGFVVVPYDKNEKKEDVKKRIEDIFSDKVFVESDKSGKSGIVKPVFDGDSDNQEYMYMMVPVVNESK